MKFSKAAYKLILAEEGMDQPSKWPGESSGITIGHGYDLGYTSPESLRADWGDYLEEQEIDRLSSACGITGEAAHEFAPRFHDIHIEREDADLVFRTVTIPHWFEQTRRALPGLDALPLDAQGALVSLVFNRGPAMAGGRRREMRNIHELVPVKDLAGIAAQLRSMRRLWPNAAGLRSRREHEAQLLEQSATSANEAIETEDEEYRVNWREELATAAAILFLVGAWLLLFVYAGKPLEGLKNSTDTVTTKEHSNAR